MTTGNVQITVSDANSAAILVPGSSVMLCIGCSSAGTVGQLIVTTQPATLTANLGYGPLVEFAALMCLAGGTVIAIKTTQNAAGTAEAVQFTGTGTSVITTTLDGTVGAFDTYYVKLKVKKGGTIGTGPITVNVSLDAGRNYGPDISLGTANTLAIPNTGITLAFAAGTLVTGDVAQFATIPPAWNDAGVQAALNAFQASQYAVTGVGAAYLVGACAGTDGTTIGGYMETLATGYIFNRLMCETVDVTPPTTWGGAGQTEAAWTAAVLTSWSAVSQRRINPWSGYYNMPSAFPNTIAGAPRYRRPGGWAAAARQITLPPQRMSSRVRDGALSNIVIDPVNDPNDGLVYHDERLNPGFDAARFGSFTTRIDKPGMFVRSPNLMAPAGSNVTLLPLGNVLDNSCSVIHQSGDEFIDDDVRLNADGTIFELDARAMEQKMWDAMKAEMSTQVSSWKISVSRTQNVQATGVLPCTVSIIPRGYIRELDATIGFNVPGMAGTSVSG